MKLITLLYQDKNSSETKKELSISFKVDENPSSYGKNLDLIFAEFLAFVKAAGFIVADGYELRLSEKQRTISLNDFPNSLNGTKASDFNFLDISDHGHGTRDPSYGAVPSKEDLFFKNKKSDLLGPEDC